MPKFHFTVEVEAEGWTRQDFEKEAERLGTMTVLELSGAETEEELDSPEQPSDYQIAEALGLLLSQDEAWAEAWAGTGDYVHVRSAKVVKSHGVV